MVNLKHLITLLFLASLSINATAVQLNKLYNASVPVPTQGARDRAQGLKVALSQVLVRIIGDEQRVLDGALQRQFESPENYVLSFAYRENPEYLAYLEELAHRKALQADLESNELNSEDLSAANVLNEAPGNETNLEGQNEHLDELFLVPLVEPDQFLLDVVFAESSLKKRMQTLSLPVWGSTRPSILVWVVKDDMEEGRSVVGSSEIDQYLPELMDQADIRGVPIYLPVADLTDLSLLDVDGLWGLFSDSHIEASRRYNADAVVILRLHSTPDDAHELVDEINVGHSGGQGESADTQVKADWQLFLGEQSYYYEFHATAEELSKSIIANLARTISSQYAVSGSQESDSFLIEVVGINNFSDYIGVQRYLAALAPVAAASMIQAEFDKLLFKLTLRDTKEMFFQHVSLGRKLIKFDDQLTTLPQQDIILEPVQKFVWQSGN